MYDRFSWETVSKILRMLEGLFHCRAMNFDTHPQVDMIEQRTVRFHLKEKVDVLGTVVHVLGGFHVSKNYALQ